MKKLFGSPQVWLFVGIFLAGCILRFVYLDRVPAGISDDELDTVLTARSVYLTGKTLEGTFSPFSFQIVPPGALVPFARAPYMLLAPFSGLLHRGLGEVKIPFAIISLMTGLILAGFSWKLWGGRVALFTSFVFIFNPWSIYFGRTAFDTPLSVFFLYIFLFCLMTLRNWWLLTAIIPWFIGLYSYEGMIIIYPLVLGAGTIGSYILRKRLYKKQYICLAVIGIALFSFFMSVFGADRSGTRMNEIATPNSSIITARVDDIRRKSVQTPINSIVTNKYTVASWQILGQYIGAFSTYNLFISGEGRSTFSVWSHGLFYSIDFILLIIGIYGAYRVSKTKTKYLVTLMLIAPIPSAISTTGVSYALRSSFMYPIFSIFIAIGLATVLSIRRHRYIIYSLVAILYFIVITNFLHIYFIQNPVANSEGFGFSNRVLSKYMKLASDANMHVIFIGNNVLNSYRQHMFYTDYMTSKNVMEIQTSIRMHSYTIGNISFIECPTNDINIFPKQTVITPYGKACPAITAYKNTLDPLAIAQLSDSGRIFEIYNDTVCTSFTLSEYQPLITFADLNVEAMTTEKFCKTYISHPKPDKIRI